MARIFFVLFCSAILTLWVPGYAPVAIFQTGVFVMAAVVIYRARRSPLALAWPFVPLGFAVLWGLFQSLTARTVSTFETRVATLRWAALLCVFLVGSSLFQDEAVRRWFRSALLWFAFGVAVVATLQTFTSGGKVFWLFPTPYTDSVMGPILYPNHYAVFVEAILPLALYRALSEPRDSLLYSVIAGVLYASVLASASRTGTILSTAEILIVPLLLWMLRRVQARDLFIRLIPLAILFSVFVMVVSWEPVWARLKAPDPMALRRELNVSSVQMVQANPWLGTGLGTWPIVYPQYAVIDIGVFVNQAHNDWLQWTEEGGLPFSIMMGSLFFWSLWRGFESIWGLGVAAVFLHAAVDYPFSRAALACWPILILSLVSSEKPRAWFAPALTR